MTDTNHVLDTPPAGAKTDWTVSQDWSHYTAEEHATWDTLFARQAKLLPGRASDAYLRGLDVLKLSKPGIPDFEELSERLMKLTGWQVVAVPGLVPDEVFFDHMANRRFVAGNFIRRPDQLDYLQEPDVFHDVFGHVPMLADPVFADYLEAYGRGGQRALGLDALKYLGRLILVYRRIRADPRTRWVAHLWVGDRVELYRKPVRARRSQPEPDRIRHGAGHADRLPDRRFPAELLRHLQASTNLLRMTVETDFAPLYEELKAKPDVAVAAIVEGDDVITRGTQDYARNKATAG